MPKEPVRYERKGRQKLRTVVGCYAIFDAADGCLYIGQSRWVGGRISSHGDKVWWQQWLYVLVWECSREELREVERELIRQYRPLFNKALNRNTKETAGRVV